MRVSRALVSGRFADLVLLAGSAPPGWLTVRALSPASAEASAEARLSVGRVEADAEGGQAGWAVHAVPALSGEFSLSPPHEPPIVGPPTAGSGATPGRAMEGTLRRLFSDFGGLEDWMGMSSSSLRLVMPSGSAACRKTCGDNLTSRNTRASALHYCSEASMIYENN